MHDHISPEAQRIGRYMAENCPKGLPEHFDTELVDAFPDLEARAIKLALAELEAEGFVTLSHAINRTIPSARATYALFVACDPAITGHDPIEDSVVLARLLIDDPDLCGRASRLEQTVGWARRRFNPAFAQLIPLIPKGRVRKAIQDEYPRIGMVLTDEDIVQLQRYVRTHAR